MIRTVIISLISVILLSSATSVYAGAPSPKDFDVFIEAENPLSTYGFGVVGPPRSMGYSGNGFLNLWQTDAPTPPGYTAKYTFNLEKTGNFYIIIWVQSLNTPYSSPFQLTLDKQVWSLNNETAKPLPDQIPYGEDMTRYFVGPVALQSGQHTLSIIVNTRRAYSDNAYNLLVDAIALTQKDPLTPETPPAVSLTVDAANTLGSFSPLTDLSQGGISQVTDPAFWDSVAPIVNDLGTSLVRIDHIFDDSYYGVVNKALDGSYQYDWSRLDAVISQILKTNEKPFLCLSYMPSALSRDGTPYQAPRNLKDWQALCERLVRHMKSRFNLTGLYYEVWNEPDLKEFWKGSQSDYLDLYRATAEAIKGIDPSAKVGGPAISSAVTGWLSPFLQFVKSRKLQLDFVSWHLYNQDPAAYSQQIQYIRQTLSALDFPPDIALFLTEWNSSGSLNPANDAFYNAGRTAAVLSVLQDKNISKAFFLMPKDYPNPQILYGGWGLVTCDDRPKPSYDCLDAYNRLRGGQEIKITSTDSSVSGLGVIKDDTLEFLLWNYSGEQPFGQARDVHIILNLAGTPFASGTLNQDEYLIDSQHSTTIQNHDMPNLQLVDSKSLVGKGTLEETIPLENGGVMYIELHHILSPPTNLRVGNLR